MIPEEESVLDRPMDLIFETVTPDDKCCPSTGDFYIEGSNHSLTVRHYEKYQEPETEAFILFFTSSLNTFSNM